MKFIESVLECCSRSENIFFSYVQLRSFFVFLIFIVVVFSSPIFFYFYVPKSISSIVTLLTLSSLLLVGVELGYHRYLSHRSFKTGRVMKFILISLGCLSLQHSPLWWRTHHLNHHKYSDRMGDPHSPKFGFINSYFIWLYKRVENFEVHESNVDSDIRIINSFFYLPSIIYCAFCYFFSSNIKIFFELIIIYLFSVCIVLNIFFTINSIGHLDKNYFCSKFLGYRNYSTRDHSRNLYLLSFFSLGASLHNNHHKYPSSYTTSTRFWEVDLGGLLLDIFKYFGLVWDLKTSHRSITSKNSIKESSL